MILHVLLRAIFYCDLRLRSLRRANFNCDLCAILQSLRRAIFDCDLCGARSSILIFGCKLFFGRSLVVKFSLDVARSDAVSFGLSFAFGRCLFRTFFWTMRGYELVAYPRKRLFRTPSLLDAVSFFGRGSFRCCLFCTFFRIWTLSLLDFLLDDTGF